MTTCLFQKVFFTVYFIDKKEKEINLPHSAKRKHAFTVKTNKKAKSKKIAPRKKVSLELLHNRLRHISTRLLMSGYTAYVWQDIELMIYPDPFFTPCQISSMNKKDRSKNLLKLNAPFKWVFMEVIPATPPKSLTSENTFSNYLLIVDAH